MGHLSAEMKFASGSGSYVANHPFSGIVATVGGAQFTGTIGSWLLQEPI